MERARACLDAGELERAEGLFEDVLRRADVLRDDALVASIHLDVGELRLRNGDYGAARASAVVALEIFSRIGNALPRALALSLLGRVLRGSGATELAEARFREAADIAEREERTAAPVDSAGSEDAPEADQGTLLLVDDDAEVRRILVDFLSAKGFRVEVVSTGDGVFSILSRVHPDLVLLDIMMPGRDGRVILERLRASREWRDIPVIIITALRDPGEAARALRNGADDYVEKPIDPPSLHARVERLLSLRRALREAEKHKARQQLLLEIIRELSSALDTDKMLDRLVRRIAEAIGIAKCSLILADPEAAEAQLVAAYDNPAVRGLRVDLDRYPEVRQALATGELVVIDDVYTDPLLDDVRRDWVTAVNVRSSAVIPLIVQDNPIGVFLVRTTWDEPPLERSAVDFAAKVADTAGKALEYVRVFERISADLATAQREVGTYRALSLTDPLTGIANRAALDSIGTRMFLSATALDHPISVLMIDLDRFKKVNDALGHAVGDRVLQEVGRVLSDACSSDDLVVRYGGDEFCLVLPHRQLHEASHVGRRVCERIRGIRSPGLKEREITASVGLATYPDRHAPTLERLIAHADDALYRAKRAGGGHMQLSFSARGAGTE